MDCRTRRSRRRGYSCYAPRASIQPWSFIDSLSSAFILSCLVGVIYLMMQYHCTTCNSNCDLKNINKSITEIARNVACMKNKYHELELQIARFSKEIPKIEGQVELIEALTFAIEKKEAGWDPRRSMPLPNVDVYLHKRQCELGKNITWSDCPKPRPKCTT